MDGGCGESDESAHIDTIFTSLDMSAIPVGSWLKFTIKPQCTQATMESSLGGLTYRLVAFFHNSFKRLLQYKVM